MNRVHTIYVFLMQNMKLQREDWRQRPLPIDMVEYARMDAHYLLYVADCLVSELKLQKNGVFCLSTYYSQLIQILLNVYYRSEYKFVLKSFFVCLI